MLGTRASRPPCQPREKKTYPFKPHASPSPKQRTRRRVMLVHLRLREYHLREGRYPDSLEPLNLQELAIDPFSGQPFVYRLIGERYQLSSASGIS